MGELKNRKQEIFCREYVSNGLRGKDAAIAAGYAILSAGVKASQLLAEPRIKKRVGQITKVHLDEVDLNAESMLRRLKVWLDSDITDTLTMTVDQIQNDLPVEVRRLVNYYKKRTRKDDNGEELVEVELRFINKEKAYEMINKHLGFYEKDNKIIVDSEFDYGKLSDGEIVELQKLRLKAKKD